MTQHLINEIGNKYGFLTPIELTKDKNNKTAWLCRCDCGNTKVVKGSDLRAGKIIRCGKNCPTGKNNNNVSFIDETGKQYGRLTVLYRNGETTHHKTLWHCKCECGNECDVIGENLRRGITTSCGCYQREKSKERRIIDITNKRFGSLVAIRRLEEQDRFGNYYWECRCDCGKITKKPTAYLTSGNTQSCGDHTSSHGENSIENFLLKNKINYQKQYKFKDLLGNNKFLRFDFAVFDNSQLKYLIEYNGIQHYRPIDHFGGEEKFKLQQQYDLKKIEYCEKHNIPLIIIKYNENIEEKRKEIKNE